MEIRLERLLKQLKREFIKVNFLQASLDSIAIFLGSNLVIFLVDLKLIDSTPNIQALAAAAGAFFIGDLVYRSRKYRLEIFEEKNPELKEALRTARDNKHKNDIASQALFDDVLERANNVKSESIIPSKRIAQKIGVVGVLSFITVLSGLGDVQIIESADETSVLPSIEEVTQTEDDNETEISDKRAEQIYGEKDDIDVSSTFLNFSIEGEGQSEGQVNLSQPEQEDFTFTTPERQLTEDLDIAREYGIWVRSRE